MKSAIKAGENAATNRLIETVLLVKMLAGIIEYFSSSGMDNGVSYVSVLFFKILLPMYALNIVFHFIALAIGYNRPVTTNILLTEMIINFAISYLLYGNFVLLNMAIPIIISARTLNRKEMRMVSFFTWFLFVLTVAINIHLDGVSELFHSIHLEQETSIWEYPENTFVYYVIPTSFAFIMLVIVVDNIIAQGRKSFLKTLEQSSRIAVLNSEFETASQIQQNALPQSNFSTKYNELSIKAVEKPAKEVGGDFFDYIQTDEDHVAFLVADVSDKGLPAAMFMMSAQKTLRILLKSGKDLSDTVRTANRVMCQDNRENMFLTLWMGIADIRNHTIEYVNCGHPMPVLAGHDGNVGYIKNEPNIIIGCFPEAEYTVHRMSYESGDRLVIYTDGITDARNMEDIAFGDKGLLETVKRGTTSPDGIIAAGREFMGEAPQFDDMTVMEISFS